MKTYTVICPELDITTQIEASNPQAALDEYLGIESPTGSWTLDAITSNTFKVQFRYDYFIFEVR